MKKYVSKQICNLKYWNSLWHPLSEEEALKSSFHLKDSGGYGGSIVCISGGSDGPLELIIHTDPKILLYSERIFETPECDLPEEFGSCSLTIVDKKRDFYICVTPACGIKVHLKCDKTIKNKPAVHQFCPTCRNLNPATWKPFPGTARPRWRRKWIACKRIILNFCRELE